MARATETTDTKKRASGFVATALAKTPCSERAELLSAMMRQCADNLAVINGHRGATEEVYRLGDAMVDALVHLTERGV